MQDSSAAVHFTFRIQTEMHYSVAESLLIFRITICSPYTDAQLNVECFYF